MKVQILYFDGCPHYEPTLQLVQDVSSALGVIADVQTVEVRSNEDASRLGFVGSPTVRVNGVDIEPAALEGRDYALSCRVYEGSGIPPRRLLEAAFSQADRGEYNADA